MKQIPLGDGLFAVIDDDDWDLVSTHKWKPFRTPRTTYAQRREGRQTILMHRVILGAQKGSRVDHRDHDGLNNTKANLRPATHTQNMQNKSKKTNALCPFKGVYVDRSRGDSKPFRAQIVARGVKVRIGSFASAVDAARAYDVKAIELHGDFAATNVALGILLPLAD